LPGEVHFVDRDYRRLARAPQQLRKLGIERKGAGAAIDHLDDARCGVDGDASLAQDFAGNSGLVLRNDPARIDHLKFAPVPLRPAVDAVARDSRLVGYDRTA